MEFLIDKEDRLVDQLVGARSFFEHLASLLGKAEEAGDAESVQYLLLCFRSIESGMKCKTLSRSVWQEAVLKDSGVAGRDALYRARVKRVHAELSRLRRDSGMSVRAIADAAAVSTTTVQALTDPASLCMPQRETLDRIARVFGTTAHQLLNAPARQERRTPLVSSAHNGGNRRRV